MELLNFKVLKFLLGTTLGFVAALVKYYTSNDFLVKVGWLLGHCRTVDHRIGSLILKAGGMLDIS